MCHIGDKQHIKTITHPQHDSWNTIKFVNDSRMTPYFRLSFVIVTKYLLLFCQLESPHSACVQYTNVCKFVCIEYNVHAKLSNIGYLPQLVQLFILNLHAHTCILVYHFQNYQFTLLNTTKLLNQIAQRI